MKSTNLDSDLTLILAAQNGNAEQAKQALRHGANVNCTTIIDPFEGVTPLMLASRNAHRRAVKVLLDAGANVQKRTSCIIPGEEAKETALHWAVVGGDTVTCKLLIDEGADVKANSTRGSPLTYAVESGSLAIVKLLLSAGAKVNTSSGRECRLPLDLAAEIGRADILKVLLKRGAKPKPNRLSGKTPLMLSSVSNHPKSAALLIRAKDPINARDNNGWTPLMYAAWGQSGECTQLLLNAGANPKAKEKHGKTALDLAREVDSYEAASYLEDALIGKRQT